MDQRLSFQKIKPSSEMYAPFYGSYIRDDETVSVTISLGTNHYNTFNLNQDMHSSSDSLALVDACSDYSDDDCSFEMT